MGLGNPGAHYAGHRHNVGAQVLDTLAGQLRVSFKAHKARAAVAETFLRPGGPRLVLAKPHTYMNLSGGPVVNLARFYGIEAERVLVVHDELDLPFATLRLKVGGGEGGHNGLRDISKALGTRDYVRLRFGIGRPPGRQDAADFVLRDFSTAERTEVDVVRHEAIAAIEDTVDLGLVAAQQRLHSPS